MKGIKEQIKNNEFKYPSKFKKEDLKSIINEIFNSKTKKKNKEENNLYVYANKETNLLTFKIPSLGILYLGIDGFLNYIDLPWNKNYNKIFLNGLELDKELVEEFWKWMNNIKKLNKK